MQFDKGVQAAVTTAKKWTAAALGKWEQLTAWVVAAVKSDLYRTLIVTLSAIAIVVAIAILHFTWPFLQSIVVAYSNDSSKVGTLIISLVALHLTMSNYRRGNYAIVKLVEVTESGTSRRLGVNRNQMYAVLDVRIKVLGIPLRNPAIVLQGYTRIGRLSVPLKQFEDDKPVASDGTLEKGMIASYGLRSFDMNAGERQMFSELVDPEAEYVAISIFSNGYFVKRFLLQRKPFLRKAIRRWNDWAAGANFRYMSKHHIKFGRPVIQTRDVIPQFADRMYPLERFANALKQERNNPPSTMFPSGPPGTPPHP